MKFKSFNLPIIAALAFAAPALAAKVEPGSYTVDKAHSKVGFEVEHMMISSVEGHFNDFEGTIEIAEPFNKSTVTAEAKIDSVDTANADRDKHLKSPDFFDEAKHPKMTLVTKKIEGSPDSFRLVADLTIKGVTKQVTFNGKFKGAVTDPWGNRKAGFQATAEINRKDFGLNWSKMTEKLPVVGDKVKIELRVEAAKKKAQTAAN